MFTAPVARQSELSHMMKKRKKGLRSGRPRVRPHTSRALPMPAGLRQIPGLSAVTTIAVALC
jgi:hypothetical protein